MRNAKSWLIALGATAVGMATPHASAGDWAADPNGCKVWSARPAMKEAVEWSGACVDGFAEGKGTLRWTVNGQPTSTYEGDMKAGRRSGQGVLTLAQGFRYEGSFRDDVYAGQGSMSAPAGWTYRGEWVAGRLDGACTMNWPDGARYEGECKSSRPEGPGRMAFANGDRYAGTLRAGRPAGHGRYDWAGGDSYEGAFVAGDPVGAGVYRFADGSRYEGSFGGGVPAGRGRLETAGGLGYEGLFESGAPGASGVFFKAGAPAPEDSQQLRQQLSLPYAKPQAIAAFRQYATVGMVCRKMARPEVPPVKWKGQALYRAVATVRDGRVVDVEMRPGNSGIDPSAQKAFTASIQRALASYDCPGNHVFEQEFLFAVK